ncbi:hypothetical protein [Rhodococcus coprophilus]|uniref:Uncharacterized protein n=1 Tax=Rhodococcus coprophilus TaxID=38310 RepID=A0A2X4U7Q1_9NOCA|nr:hypothetical protein [Rhodococcus coprophilus]MBM7457769.1 hypothetical protein [Rhodococcus coprophilus]SQI30392.1 Uncharacterised protein [Rhodococcus coprophilus]
MSVLSSPGRFEEAVCFALGLTLLTLRLGTRRGIAIHAGSRRSFWSPESSAESPTLPDSVGIAMIAVGVVGNVMIAKVFPATEKTAT